MHSLLFAAIALFGSLEDDARFREAQALYRELEFEKATIRFEEAALASERTPEERALIFTWVGLCHAQLGDFLAARNALVEAVQLAPDVELPPDAPPRLVEMLAEVQREAAAAATAAPPGSTTSDGEAQEPAAPSTDLEGAGPSPFTLGGFAAVGVGAAALAGAVAFGVASIVFEGVSNDPATTQRGAKEAGDMVNLTRAGSAVSVGASALFIAAGAALFLLVPE